MGSPTSQSNNLYHSMGDLPCQLLCTDLCDESCLLSCRTDKVRSCCLGCTDGMQIIQNITVRNPHIPIAGPSEQGISLLFGHEAATGNDFIPAGTLMIYLYPFLYSPCHAALLP